MNLALFPTKINLSKTYKTALKVGETGFKQKRQIQLNNNADFQTVSVPYLKTY